MTERKPGGRICAPQILTNISQENKTGSTKVARRKPVLIENEKRFQNEHNQKQEEASQVEGLRDDTFRK